MSKTMSPSTESRSAKCKAILRAVMPVFGRFGFRKTSVEDLARAAGLSKQGLYLHFASKEDVFAAAMQLYLDEGLELLDTALASAEGSLVERLTAGMDAWFGRHLTTFTPDAFDVIQAGNHLSPEVIDAYKRAFRARLVTAIEQSPEFDVADSPVSPEELARILFTFGLTWKETWSSRREFVAMLHLCVTACISKNGRPMVGALKQQ
ncbi:TetR/AcrR family transcriptional regulator [Geomonas subterranea]|uniref:TetR/AcrR family transcriptional regulator n=1 Tax=Geomonas subterranea TaxID=2847989 RepID=UPI001CD4F312|nr:TetR/AcrR family transcriptional regulator [Geomonas fuzhouensis]